VIGVAEYVDFPDWGVRNLRARIDTGARSSALHVENVRELSGGRVRFEVRLRKGDAAARAGVTAKIARRASVRSSSGQVEPRLFVRVWIVLGGREQRIEVGLVDRSAMQYRMLLGRSALQHRYLVDVTKRYALGGARQAKSSRKR
jgi:hypothetical protein